MSIRNLDSLFKPRSVALVGASQKPRSVGAVTAHNLLAAGFSGPVMPVNPKYDAVAGVLAYPDVASLPTVPDLAVICTPPATVPGLIAELGTRGVKGSIVITAGFSELGTAEGKALEQAMLDAARPHLMRIVGPNCVGVISTASDLNATFGHLQPAKGNIAFVTQSGAMALTVLDWAMARGIGFSHLVSLGNMSDVDFGDMLDYLATDPHTTAVLLYVEAITAPRKFMSAARAASRLKPVIVIKAGRHREAAKAAASHTGALAGADGVYNAAFRRAGMLRVIDLDEVFDALQTLAVPLEIRGDRLAILTNGGGIGVLATDALIDLGGRLAELSPQTVQRLGAVLPPTWSKGNPVDIIGDAPGSRYAAALEILLEAPEADAVLVLNCPTAVASGVDAAQAVVEVLKTRKRSAALTSWLGSQTAEAARRLFTKARVPSYDTPDKAIRGFNHLVQYRRNQDMLMQAPTSVPAEFTPDHVSARRIVAEAVAAGRVWLDDAQVRDLLACYRIPTVRSQIAATPEEAAKAAGALGGRTALKIFSPDITHKSDVGGVVLDLARPDDVRRAATEIRTRVAAKTPQARLDGFVVQEMIRRPRAHELILGIAVDATFGPFLLFGHGGTAVEVINDKTLALPPLNLDLAHEMITCTRVSSQLRGYRDRPPAAIDAIALTLVQLSQLVTDLDEVIELDINPLLADADGVLALDARVRVAPFTGDRGHRLAIRPYPKELERTYAIGALGNVLCRPVRPEDEQGFLKLFARLTPEDVRLRFFAPLRELPQRQLARLTQIDYDREMAFVLEMRDGPEAGEILGVARLAADPDHQKAEFAITVRSDLKGRGIGRHLMERLLGYAKERGIGEIFGDILAENTQMLALCRDFDFAIKPLDETVDILRATRRP